MKQLTKRQLQVFDYVERFINCFNYPPSIRDIQEGCEISSTSVVYYNLHRLAEHGYLNVVPGISRGIVLTKRAAR